MQKAFEKAPIKYTLHQLLVMCDKKETTRTIRSGDKWVIARPEGRHGFISRTKKAWMVFTGRADIVVWPGDQ
jgi:hypothetical protein